MLLWLSMAGLTLAAVAYMLWPMLRRVDPVSRAAYDLEVYRAQLAELERDRARGIIEPGEHIAAVREIERRLLDTATALDKDNAAQAAQGAQGTTDTPAQQHHRRAMRSAARGLALVLIVLLVPASAVLLYGRIGDPFIPGVPFAERPVVADTLDADDPRLVALRDLQQQVAEAPDDGEAWLALGRTHVVLNQYEDAVTAFERAVATTDSRPDALAMLGEAHVFLGEGFVTASARQNFEAALAADPAEPRAHFYVGIADYQAGRTEAALERWVTLASAAPTDAPWLPTVRERIAVTARELGRDEVALLATLPAPGGATDAPPGIADEDLEERVAGMIAGLAARLDDDPDDLEGWLMLGRSYLVIRQPRDALTAFTAAVGLAAENVDALTGQLTAAANLAPEDAEIAATLPAMIDNILVVDPDNVDGLWFAGGQAFQAGDTETAAVYWRRLVELLPPGSREAAIVATQLDSLGQNQQ